MAGKPWTEEQIERVRELRAEGVSFKIISEKFGCSRSAIAGLCHRCAIKSTTKTVVRKPNYKPQKGVVALRKTKPIVKRVVLPPAERTVARNPAELAHYHCRWPVGDPKDKTFYYCSEERVTGRPYCAEHINLAYIPLKAS
jgi:GcrA cell cycle regulator